MSSNVKGNKTNFKGKVVKRAQRSEEECWRGVVR
jgi:hypothetical protein